MDPRVLRHVQRRGQIHAAAGHGRDHHLALGLVEELEEALEWWPGPLVVVSHDRALRRRFTGRIRRMDSGHLLG
ncbi:hypothetical protein [Streptomyces sp. NPDC048266]|uniref:hypothetical protein n=1 Tax=Streptomyces sp. NPDC048266 TaxID=3155787 RepID=UPI0033ECC4D9